MNMIKKNGGFTLVELIVVIAILAILAGVAVPAYSGYINSANEAADITALGAVKTSAMAAYATEGTVTKIVVTEAENGTTVEVTVDPTSDTALDATDFDIFYGGEISELELKTGSTATWDITAGADEATKGEWVISGE